MVSAPDVCSAPRAACLLVTLLLLAGCGPDENKTGNVNGSDTLAWAQTRHGIPAVVTQPACEFQGGVGPDVMAASSAAAATAPTRVIVLHNLDDDDGDGVLDRDDTSINGVADADDLAHVVLTPVPADRGKAVWLRLDPQTATRADGRSEIRVFLAGKCILGPLRGGLYAFTEVERTKLEEGSLDLYLEAVSFQASSDLHLYAGDEVSDAPENPLASLSVVTAPLLFADHAGTPLRLAVVGGPEGSRADAFRSAMQTAWVEAGLDPGNLLVVDEGDSEPWIQDEFQWAYAWMPGVGPWHVAIHMPRGRGLHAWVKGLPGEFGLHYHSPTSYDFSDPQAERLLYGGNVEVSPPLPGAPMGVRYAGLPTGNRQIEGPIMALLEELEAFLASAPCQPLVRPETWWLKVGHVDEFLTFLPNLEDPSRMFLLVASPAKGVEILEAAMEDPALLDKRVDSSTLAIRYLHHKKSDPFEWDQILGGTVGAGDEEHLADYNRALQERILGTYSGMEPEVGASSYLGEFLAQLPVEAREAIDVVQVPTLFYKPQLIGSGVPDGHVTAMVPNMMNLVALGRHLLVPDPHVPLFASALVEALPGYELHFVDTFWYLHVRSGGVHCATNAAYAPEEASPWWTHGDCR